MKRRDFVNIIPALGLGSAFANTPQTPQATFPISSNGYNWITFYAREGKEWGKEIMDDMANYAKTGLKAFEPGINDLEHAKKLVEATQKFKISMPSVYVNSLMHIKEEVDKSINDIIAIADLLKKQGTKIIVTNPNPIKWGSKEVKSDEQLKVQATALEKLNLKLKAKNMVLAYHTHDMEMEAGAREFHHMLQNTTVGFCFDLHWIYRGSQNSALAVYDVLKMYGKRIVELHIRQSKDGIWTETFTADGDIDYNKVAKTLKDKGIKPHLVIEQCLEEKSTGTLDAVAAHLISFKAVKSLFLD